MENICLEASAYELPCREYEGGYLVKREDLEGAASLWRGSSQALSKGREGPVTSVSEPWWPFPFTTPPWWSVWWDHFACGGDLFLWSIHRDGRFLGLAPLVARGREARFPGGPDVCDYLDFVVAPGREREFFTVLTRHLELQGVERLALEGLRPESAVLSHWAPLASELGCEMSWEAEAESFELDLPPSWEEYLQGLKSKQRHEVRRKLRRLEEAGRVSCRVLEAPREVIGERDKFLSLFRTSRPDKAAFLQGPMDSFFRSMIGALAQEGILKFFVMEMDGETVAVLLYFDYGGTVYLYNNGYDRRYRSLNVGLLSKVLAIRESIERGYRRYDFMKGSEVYKERLGGRSVPVHTCKVKLGGIP